LLRFDADVVVHGSVDPLLTAEITLCYLHRNVSEKELDLVQFSASGMAQLRARATQIMRCESAETEFLRIVFHYVPDCPLRNEDSGMRIVPIQISPESLLFQNGHAGQWH
jgi:hypothetical protein